jgi:hypothetical protein
VVTKRRDQYGHGILLRGEQGPFEPRHDNRIPCCCRGSIQRRKLRHDLHGERRSIGGQKLRQSVRSRVIAFFLRGLGEGGNDSVRVDDFGGDLELFAHHRLVLIRTGRIDLELLADRASRRPPASSS